MMIAVVLILTSVLCQAYRLENEGEATTGNVSSQFRFRLLGSFHFYKALFYCFGFSLNVVFQVFFQLGNSLIP